MGDKVFVDTNILLRSLIAEMNLHEEADKLIKQFMREEAELWISGQAIREFIVQATHPKTLETPLSIAEVTKDIEGIERLFRIADDT